MTDATEETESVVPAEAGGSEKAAEDAGAPRREGPSPYRTPALVVTRVVIVLVIAAIGYQKVIPVHSVERSRLADLVVTTPGVKEFDIKPTGAAEQKAASSGLKVLVAAAKANPNHTGVYSVEWTGKGTKDVVGVIVFLLPTETQAGEVLDEVKTQQLAPGSYTSDSLTRSSTFVVPGVPGSTGSFYAMTKKTATSVNLVATAFRTGDVVAVAEGIKARDTQAVTATVTQSEHRHLQTVASGFSLSRTTRPTVASTVWIAGSVVVAILAGLGPVLFGRARRRRQRRRQEELDRMIVVRGQTITKRRRATGA